MIAESVAELEAEDKARLRQGDVEEDLDRDSAWVRAKGAKDRWQQAEDEDTFRERIRLIRLAESFDREVERYCWRLDSVPIESL
ncbi:hypothetical protein BR93DRAFT_973204 [Coniochaeta sp. PMI_546]|nr:hypothetical protein BR93DRAFT_973204 [Coniochaeta sp. PMI_546]